MNFFIEILELLELYQTYLKDLENLHIDEYIIGYTRNEYIQNEKGRRALFRYEYYGKEMALWNQKFLWDSLTWDDFKSKEANLPATHHLEKIYFFKHPSQDIYAFLEFNYNMTRAFNIFWGGVSTAFCKKYGFFGTNLVIFDALGNADYSYRTEKIFGGVKEYDFFIDYFDNNLPGKIWFSTYKCLLFDTLEASAYWSPEVYIYDNKKGVVYDILPLNEIANSYYEVIDQKYSNIIDVINHDTVLKNVIKHVILNDGKYIIVETYNYFYGVWFQLTDSIFDFNVFDYTEVEPFVHEEIEYIIPDITWYYREFYEHPNTYPDYRDLILDARPQIMHDFFKTFFH